MLISQIRLSSETTVFKRFFSKRPDDVQHKQWNRKAEWRYDELDRYKNCNLSELIQVLIESFIPKLYERYMELNVKYTSGFQKCQLEMPKY